MLSTGEEIRSPQRSSRSGPILAKMPCTITYEFYLSDHKRMGSQLVI